MSKHTPMTLAAILLATTVAAASAQTAQDHAAHHPAAAEADARAPGQPGCPTGDMAASGNTGGEMMAGNMGAGNAGGMMMGGGMAMAPFSHIEGRIAFLKAELAITDAQAPQWNALADALRENAKGMRELMTDRMQADKSENAADRTDAMVKMMTVRLESMKSIAAAEKALYAVLTGSQKGIADELLGGPTMGMGGPMMGMGGRKM